MKNLERASNPEIKRLAIDRRTFLQLSAVGVVALVGVGTAGYFVEQSYSPERRVESFITQAGQSLIDMHEESDGGWKFKSAIQSPHYQTDRDVGAASVGMGFLSLAEAHPDQAKWLDAATQTSNWLTSISKDDGKNGRYWTDYMDGAISSESTYTSFDDGTIGIGDFYWQLYEKSHNPQHKEMALASVQWTLSRAERLESDAYRWTWDTHGTPTYNMGMGMGQTGIVTALASFYERTKDSDPELAADIKRHAEGGARYIAQVINREGSLPETDGGDAGKTLNSGYLSGAAGSAYMYLKLYQTFGEQHYLDEAQSVLAWLEKDSHSGGSQVTFKDGSKAWKISVGPGEGNDDRYATGYEEGCAGIGWTYLQAYEITGNSHYLNQAASAADWLIANADTTNAGWSWPEDKNSDTRITHANLNNGAAGIGMFLRDVALKTKQNKYNDAAFKARDWIMSTARTDKGVYWNDNDGEHNYSRDPSWHWGTAGIINALIRINGGQRDIPGEQPRLHK